MAAGGPDLLTVDDPLVAVVLRLGLEAGEVGAGTRLAEELTPCLLSGDDGAHVASICSCVPCVAIVGAASSSPRPPGRAERAELGDRVRDEHGVATREAAAVGVSGRVGADQPARPRRSHHSATVRSGSQFSSSQACTSSTTSLLVEEGRSVVSVMRTASPIRAIRSAPNHQGSTRRLRRQRCVGMLPICRYSKSNDLNDTQEFHERRIHHRHR